MTKKEKELVEKAGNLAFQNEKKYSGCTQAVLGAFREIFGDDVIPEQLFKAGTGMCGGVGNTGNTCGALSGGVLVLSLFTGRDSNSWKDSKKMFHAFGLSQKLINHFKEKYYSSDCRGVQEKIFGRSFNTNFEDGLKAFLDAGGHTDKCPLVVKEAAEKTMELLLAEKLVNADDFI